MNLPPNRSVARIALVTLSIAALIAIAFLFVWEAIHILLVVFAGILLALFLRGLADLLGRLLPVPPGVSLAIVILLLLGLVVGGVWLLAPNVAEQIDQLSKQLPKSVQHLESQLRQYAWGRELLQRLQDAHLSGGSSALKNATGFFSSTFGILANVVIFFFVGLYLAAQPGYYLGGLLSLVPPKSRERARHVLAEVGHLLRWWLVGRFFSMGVIGILSAVGLWLLGIPLALTLGILAALLTFVPNIGPIISVVPPALLGLMQSPTTALWVILLYIGIQGIESYLLTPLVQRRAVEMPPALTIVVQLLLGVLWGSLGLILATPLTVATIVFVKMLYIHDLLGEPIEVGGHSSDPKQKPAKA